MITTEFIEQNKGKRFNIELSDGKKLNNIGFFMYGETFCYLPSRNRRQGRSIPWDWDIISMTEVVKKTYTDIGNAKTILNKIHPNVWDNLKTEMNNVINGKENQDFDWHFKNKLKFRCITKLFPSWVKQELINAFENKTNFSYNLNGKKRDYSVEVKMCEDGVLRAWFASEYRGCGNGDYYLLLNPTTAIFYETD